MNAFTKAQLGYVTTFSVVLHTFTDVIEWFQGGFSSWQLWLNYIAFLPMPVVMAGLYFAGWRKRSLAALTGAILYGFAFIYFAHTTLTAIETDISQYDSLLKYLGPFYFVNGAVMIIGGAMFGFSALISGAYPKWTILLFLFGLFINLLISIIHVPDILQTAGTLFRNAGLAGMGYSLISNVELNDHQQHQ